MRLIYRGVSYSSGLIGHETIPSATVGVYRGQRTTLRAPLQAHPVMGFVSLTYRGLPYRSPRYGLSPLAVSLAEIL